MPKATKKFLFLLLMIFGASTAQASTPKDVGRDRAITKLVVAKMLQSIPSGMNRICVLALDSKSTMTRHLGELADLDGRIARNDERCLRTGLNFPKDTATIFFLGKLDEAHLKMGRPEHVEFLSSYKRAFSYVKRGFSLYNAVIGECGGESTVFVFEQRADESMLVDTLSFGPVECHTISPCVVEGAMPCGTAAK